MIEGRKVKVLQSGMGFTYISVDPGMQVGDYILLTLIELAELKKECMVEGAKMALNKHIPRTFEDSEGGCSMCAIGMNDLCCCKDEGLLSTWYQSEARRIVEGK